MILTRMLPRWSWKIALPITLVAVTAELSWHAHRVFRVVPAGNFRDESEIVSFLKENAGNARVLAEQELLSDWEAWRHGISKVHGYEPVPPARAVVMMDAMSERRTVQDELIGLQPVFPVFYRQNVVNYLGVKYAVLPAGITEPRAPWKIAARGEVAASLEQFNEAQTREYEIWENTDVLPRAFVLGNAEVSEPDADYVETLARINATRAVIVPKDVLPNREETNFSPGQNPLGDA